MENRTLTDRQINNRMTKLMELEAEIKELEALQDAIKDEIKAHMGDLEHIETDKFKVNYTNVTSERFDSKTFKAEHEEMYKQYAKKTETRRFTYKDK